MPSDIIHLKELRLNLAKYAKKVAKDHASFVVYKKSKPLFKIVPLEEEAWETVVDFTQVHERGVPLQKVLKALRDMA